MKILNLYAGIGGNRKLWGEEHEVTAIEYDEKIEPQKLGRHLFWSNVKLPQKKFELRGSFDNAQELADKLGYDISNWKGVNKILLLRNCVEPEVAKYILDCITHQYEDKGQQ